MNFLCQKVNKKSRRGEKKTTTGPDIKLSEGFSHFLTALFLFAPCAPPSLAAADTPFSFSSACCITTKLMKKSTHWELNFKFDHETKSYVYDKTVTRQLTHGVWSV